MALIRLQGNISATYWGLSICEHLWQLESFGTAGFPLTICASLFVIMHGLNCHLKHKEFFSTDIFVCHEKYKIYSAEKRP